jgi:DNA-binding IclR family transcriptional regulator
MIGSLLKAIDLMQLFTPAEPRLTLAEISRRLDMPKSTAHNLLATLMSRGYIEKVDRDHYALGTAVIELTQGVRVNVELRDRAAPLLREMADASRETAYLTVLDRDHSLYIYGIESPRRLLARTAVGDRAMLHCTSVGKAILAFLPSDEIHGIVERVGLPAFTPATITDPDRLDEELVRIRARGYATDTEEHEPGTFCVGAPIRDERGRVIGSCSLSGSDPAIVNSREAELSERVIYTAQEISRRMGYVPATPSSVAIPHSRPNRPG